MHEYSIVQSLIDSSEDHTKSNGAKKVLKLVVKIGVMSGVEPDLLQTAFDTFKESTVCEDAIMVINIQKVKIFCNGCEKESELEKNEYVCPCCKSTNINILDGEDMFLMQLELGY